MVYMFLADGFEEIEALAVVDILRRGGVEIKTVSIGENLFVTGAHNISVKSDISANEIKMDAQCVILPGGLPGTTNLGKSSVVEKTVMDCYKNGGIIAAICAAPSVFYKYGLLNEKKATAYPGYDEEMPLCNYTGRDVETDGNIITSKGAGTAHLFGFEILKVLKNEETAQSIKKAMQYRN